MEPHSAIRPGPERLRLRFECIWLRIAEYRMKNRWTRHVRTPRRDKCSLTIACESTSTLYETRRVDLPPGLQCLPFLWCSPTPSRSSEQLAPAAYAEEKGLPVALFFPLCLPHSRATTRAIRRGGIREKSLLTSPSPAHVDSQYGKKAGERRALRLRESRWIQESP